MRRRRRGGARVLMLLQNASYPTDGRVLREATALVAAGHSVTVACPRAPGQPWRETLDGVRLVRFPTPTSHGGAAGFLLEYAVAAPALLGLALEALVRDGVDVVHCHNPPDFLVPLAAVLRPFGARLVFDQHDLSPELYSARFGARARPWLRRALERLESRSWRLADHVITSNASQRRIGAARAGMPPEHATVVRNGPDWRVLGRGPVDGAPRRPAARTVIGYGGCVGPQDGLEHLVRALAHLVGNGDGPDVHLLVVGDGDALPAAREEARRAGVLDRISFLGWRPYEEFLEWLAACDVCVAPEPSNPYNDSCTSLKVMEYMALGRAIVAVDLPEHRHSAGEAAAYVPPGDDVALADAIAALAADPDRRVDMGATGLRRVHEELAWTHEAPALLAAYQRLLGR